jgi:hypothetical protein
MMLTAVYALCILTSLISAALLLRGYRRSGAQLLFWAALCFFGLAANNLLLLIDAHTTTPLLIWRKLPAVVGVLLLLYGLVTDTK